MEKAPGSRGHPAVLHRGFLAERDGPQNRLAAFQRVTVLRPRRPRHAGTAHSAGGSEFFADDAAECFLK